MVRNIERLAMVLVLCFGVVSVSLGYWQTVRAGELLSDPTINHARLYEEERRVQRGQILDRNGQVLATTEMSGDIASRVYAAPWLAHVTGHHSLRFGNSNVEHAYDSYLRGKTGADVASAFKDRLLHRPIQGSDVVLTIDHRLQQVAEEALGDSAGAILVMNPRTGEILALASHPYYDPNKLEQEWEQLRDDASTPLLNRATQGLYAPGSVFKTVTVAAALDSGMVDPSQRFDFTLSAGQPPSHAETFHGFPVTCANHPNDPPGKLSMNLTEAYAASCNVAFAELGVKIGHQRLIEYANRFGFGADLPGELASVPSQLAGDAKFLRDDAALASTAFGQGQLLVSPLQVSLVTNAIANHGTIMEPHVVKEVRREGQVVARTDAVEWRKPIQSATADAVRSMMVQSVERGWASSVKIPGVAIGGKTGTAETGDGQQTHAWFTAFAPADDPVVSVTVVKEHAGFGSAQAIPPAKKVLEAALAPSP